MLTLKPKAAISLHCLGLEPLVRLDGTCTASESRAYKALLTLLVAGFTRDPVFTRDFILMVGQMCFLVSLSTTVPHAIRLPVSSMQFLLPRIRDQTFFGSSELKLLYPVPQPHN